MPRTSADHSRSPLVRRVRDACVGRDIPESGIVPPIVLLLVFAFLDWWVRTITRLPLEAYQESSLASALLRYQAELGWRLIPSAAMAAVMAVHWRELGIRWNQLEGGSAIRLLVCVAAVSLTWSFSTYDYNFYLDQRHLADRVLLLAGCAAVIWRPWFVLPYLCLLDAVVGQFQFPLNGFSWGIQLLPMRVLVLLLAGLLARLAGLRWTASHFAFALACVFAAHYWPSGYGKWRLDWFSCNRIYFILPNTYANGWLGFVDPETIGRLTQLVSQVNGPMKVATFLLECGAVVILWKRPFTVLLLAGWILLHLGIFLLTGICFWKWMLLDAAFLWVVFRRPEFSNGLYTRESRIVSVLVVAAAPLWLNVVALVWLDTRATYTYRFQAIDETGGQSWLPPRCFQPFLYQFTLSNFGYLSPDPNLPIVWGATRDRGIAARLATASSAEDILSVERDLGRSRYNAERTAALQLFLQSFARYCNGPHAGRSWLDFLSAPPGLWTFARGKSYWRQSPIRRIRVFQVFSGFIGGRYQEIRMIPVLDVDCSEKSTEQVG